MCGIVGLFLKDAALEPELGKHLAVMLETMSDRGPDSAGFAVYGDGDAEETKITLRAPAHFDLGAFAVLLAAAVGSEVKLARRATHLVVTVPNARADAALAAIREKAPELTISSIGAHMELYKEVGLPADVARRFGLAGDDRHARHRPHAHGDEIGGDDAGAHPFSTGARQCLVHNGSLSNHNDLRRRADQRTG